MAWVNPHTISSEVGIIHKGSAKNLNDECFGLQIQTNLKPKLVLKNNSGTTFILTAQKQINLNEWTHLAAVWDSTGMYLYINGILDNSNTTIVSARTNTSSLQVGSISAGASNVNSFDGSIDEVKIYNKSITASEIQQYMCSKVISLPASLSAYVTFDLLNALQVPDKTGNNTGIITNYTLSDSSKYKILSAVPLGDISTYNNSAQGGNTVSVTLAAENRGTLSVTTTNGNQISMHIYFIGEKPKNTKVSADVYDIDNVYWGIACFGTGVQYNIVYNFSQNTSVLQPDSLILLQRSNVNDDWLNVNNALNTSQKTISINGLTSSKELWLAGKTKNTLPVEITSYKIKCTSTGSLFTWATASEVNNDYFTIEKTEDMLNWKVVTSISGAFNSNQEIQYSAIDTTMIPDKVTYYRLKQTDFDGQYKFFDVLAILCSFKNDVLDIIGINASTDAVNLIVKTNGLNPLQIYFTDITGKLISQKEIIPIKGANVVSLKTENLAKGIYIANVFQDGKTVMKKIYIQ